MLQLFDEGFTFRNFLVDVFSVFMFFIWLWLLIRVFSDVFSRHDVSGWGKVLWVIFWKLGRLKTQGTISDQEYARLRAQLVE